MSCELALRAAGLGKCFRRYHRRLDHVRRLMFSRWSRPRRCEEFWALREVSLSLRKGETFGVVGANGSGKSTLLQLICGVMKPSEGELEILGRIVGLLELGSGFNPQLSGRENAYVNAAILGLPERQIEERMQRIAAFADIGDFFDRPVRTYSSGMFLRLAFAVAAHVDADILVIDEALAVGDAAFAQKCMRHLRTFGEQGTLVLVSHDMGALTSLCQRVMWLERGRIRMIGEAKDVCEAYVAHVYGAAEQAAPPSPAPETVHSETPLSSRPDGKTGLRNVIEVLSSRQRSSAGTGAATISRVDIADDRGKPLRRVVGGQTIRLTVEALARVRIANGALSFSVKDRLGQLLFAETTFIQPSAGPVPVAEGEILAAMFEFVMPRLARGHYSVDVAICDCADGQPVILHWARDVLALQCDGNGVPAGLVGVSLNRVSLEKRTAAA